MRFIAVLNRDGGTLRTTDLDAFCGRMTETLEKAGHRIDVERVAGQEIEAALAKAAASRADIVLAGGGDGTVSAAAAALMGKKKALAILPAGTMNLFARGLGIPLSLDAAIEAFATARSRRSTWRAPMAARSFTSSRSACTPRWSACATGWSSTPGWERCARRSELALATVLDPPSLKVSLTIGDAEILTRATGIGITNNLFGEGHLPYADRPDGGVLGIYVTVARDRGQLLRFFLNMARGRWRDNPHVEIHEGEKVVLKLLSRPGKRKCVIDGELLPLAARPSCKSTRRR